MEEEERIRLMEEEIRTTPYHKGTEHHIGKLKAKIAKLKEELLTKSQKTGGGGKGYAIRKSGDATVVLVGPPSAGKSTLINQISNAQSKVAAYDFTTVTVIPGMMNYKGAKIQVFDIPGIITDASKGKGKGKQVLSVVRSANLIIIMVDYQSLNKIDLVKNELHQFGIRLDEEKPKVFVSKNLFGGIKITSTCSQTHMSLNTIKELASEFKIRNGEIVIKENISLERLIDAFMENRVYLPYLVVINKSDLINKKILFQKDEILISAKKGVGLTELKEKIWDMLGLIRVILKPYKIQDNPKPLIIKKGATLNDVLKKISLNEKESFRKAKIFGPGAKFPGQEVSLDFLPKEGTIISFQS